MSQAFDLRCARKSAFLAEIGYAASMANGVFALQALPAELRNKIYSFALAQGYSSINALVGSHVTSLECANPCVPVKLPSLRKVTPSLLLVSRQVSAEAMYILRKHTLTLEHGLMKFRLRELITKDTFRNISSLVISDCGHDVLDKRFAHSFRGHQQMAFEVAAWLERPGHALQTLELQFTSSQLQWHLEHCWDRANGCDMRNWLNSVVKAWRKVRGVREVKISGWLPNDMKTDLTRVMQSNFSCFALLPPKVLGLIGFYSLNLDSVSRSINKANTPGSESRFPPVKTTPSILLIDSHIYEALRFRSIYTQPFELDLLHPPRNQYWSESICQYISLSSLRQIREIRIHIRHRAWLPLIFDIGHILGHRHTLRSFHFHFDDDKRTQDLPTVSGLPRRYPDWALETLLKPLALIRNVHYVSFGGDLTDYRAAQFVGHLRDRMKTDFSNKHYAGGLGNPTKRRRRDV
ncbi:hypothetical protein ANO11243_070710 [Dothideomycetidae sp. 11243]|nr:hypothetical protein ANO11243_070710 [fungal sp. No.11243]